MPHGNFLQRKGIKLRDDFFYPPSTPLISLILTDEVRVFFTLFLFFCAHVVWTGTSANWTMAGSPAHARYSFFGVS